MGQMKLVLIHMTGVEEMSKLILVIFAIVLLSGCSRENPSNYHCRPDHIVLIKDNVEECSKGAMQTYSACYSMFVVNFCDYME